MANTIQAKKRSRQNITRNERCSAQRTKARTVVKKVYKSAHTFSISNESDKSAMQTLFKTAVKVLDSTANKGVIHKNKAARIKSRLNMLVKQTQTSLQDNVSTS